MITYGLLLSVVITLFLVFSLTEQVGKLRAEIRKLREDVAELKPKSVSEETAESEVNAE